MPSEGPTTGVQANLDRRIEELERALAEARRQHNATSEILRVISNSPADARHAFAEIATCSAQLCDAYDAIVMLKDGDLLRHAAHKGPIPIEVDDLPAAQDGRNPQQDR